MPPNRLEEFVARLTGLEHKMTLHLEESGEIRADLKWLKWLVMGITGGWGAILISVVVWLIKR